MKILLEEKTPGKYSKKNSKYYWVPEAITAKNDASENSTEYFPSISEKGYIQDIKDEILEKINSENLFSFPYPPKKRDYL